MRCTWCVLLSSHVLSEVEQSCDRIGFIRDGRLRRVGSIDDLRTTRVHRVEAIVEGHRDALELARLPGVTEPEVKGDRVRCIVRGSMGPLLDWLPADDVIELDSREPSLEEVFLSEFTVGPHA